MSALVAEAYGVQELVDAWEKTLQGVAELGRRLTPAQWDAATECPGWTCGDVVRHLAWIEHFLAGRPPPEQELDWSRFPHVVNDFGRITEAGVEVCRSTPQAECCDELSGLVDLRLAQILALDPLTLQTGVPGVFGTPVPFGRMIRTRTFDSWVHEQDIRRATSLPANLASPGAKVAALQMARSLGFVLARNVEAPEGTTIRLTVTGPIAFERYAAVEGGKGVDVDAVKDPTIAVTVDWETYARLACGRLDATDPEVLAQLELGGDEQLSARIPAALAMTS